jgi:hypothetical protein
MQKGSDLDDQTESTDQLEIMTTKEVLERLKIGRTKLFELKRAGKLVPGRHFIRNGRYLRFIWVPDLIKSINEKPAKYSKLTSIQPEVARKKTNNPANGSAINLDY